MKIEGRNILDEGFGPSNIRDEKGRFGNKENVANLSNMIRQGSGEGFAAIGANQSAISRGAGVVAQNMGSNTLEVQRILESTNDATREEFKKLTELMANRIGATGKAQEKALKDIAVQMEKIKIVAGEEGENISKALGFDEANKQMQGSAFSAVAKATVVDPVKDFFGYGPKNNKGFLGDKGIGKPFAVMRARRNFNAKEQAAQNLAEDSQSAALKAMGGGLDIENKSVPELLQEQKVILEEIRDGQTTSFGPMGFGGLLSALAPLAALAGIAIAIDKIVGFFGGDDNDSAAAQIGAGLGISKVRTTLANRPPPDPELKPGVFRDANDRLQVRDPDTNRTRFISEADAVAPPKAPGMGSRMMNSIGRILGSKTVSRGLPAVGVVSEGYQAIQSVGEANAELEAGTITEEEHAAILQNLAGETTGRVGGAFAGGAVGAKIGLGIGATIGSVVPGVGTAIGGAAGTIIGGAVGAIAGSALGESIGTMIAETPEEAAFDEAKEKGLYDENLFSKSTINEDLLAEETNPRILKAIINDDDLTEEDMEKVQARLFEIENPSMDMSSLERPTQTSAYSIGTMPIPTGDAVENVTALASNTNTQAPVVNNVTNNHNNSSSSNATNVFSQPLRNDNNSWSLYSTQRLLG